MTAALPLLSAQFDRVLARIEAGGIDLGIAHLGGLLDAAMGDAGIAAAVRAALLAHPLGAALRRPALVEATRALGVCASLKAREQLAAATLHQALQRGERCHVLVDHPMADVPAAVDLVLAVDLPDRTATEALAAAIKTLAARLSPHGRLVISAFLTGHLGCGWQAIWLNTPVHRHDPAAITRAAQATGLEARLFHDASGCLVWAELKRNPSDVHQGAQP